MMEIFWLFVGGWVAIGISAVLLAVTIDYYIQEEPPSRSDVALITLYLTLYGPFSYFLLLWYFMDTSPKWKEFWSAPAYKQRSKSKEDEKFDF